MSAAHPSRALLVCEVADTTLAYDRGRKLAAYARAGIPEYWILDLTGETLEVCRKPEGGGYAERRAISPNAQISPVATSERNIEVRELLP